MTSEITVTLVEQLGDDDHVAAAARVSSLGGKTLFRPGSTRTMRLVKSLVRQRHGTPVEKGYLEFYIHAPIFITREIIRHRIGVSPSEESGRYKVLEPVFWVPRRDRPMVKVEDYQPMRPQATRLESSDVYEEIAADSLDFCRAAWKAYERELDLGILPEVARRHLPLSVYSSVRLAFNPRSLMHFLSLRVRAERHPLAVLDWLMRDYEKDSRIYEILADAWEYICIEGLDDWSPGDRWALFPSYPQAEIEEVALACEQVLATGWPAAYAAFVENGRVGP